VSTERIPTRDDAVLTEIVRRLADAYQPEQIYLFGSVARGSAHPGSDYDLFIVVSDDAPEEHRYCHLAHDLLATMFGAVPVDVTVRTRSEFDCGRRLSELPDRLVLEEGILLLDRRDVIGFDPIREERLP